VRDTGIGIDKEALPYIFDMFYQGRSAIERFESGLGIGLSLVRNLVGLHGGTIEAKSDGPGKGSEFVVTLPLGVPEGAEPGQAVVELEGPSERQELRIVVVDDNVDSAHTLGMLLDLMGHKTETALDGLEAIRVIDRFRPNVVLLDIGLPEINGYDVARKIREKSWGKDIRLIALSGWGQDSDKEAARQAGFDHHLTKPVDFTTLERLLNSLDVPRQV
jgi:CheY-like chemotaxis protein